MLKLIFTEPTYLARHLHARRCGAVVTSERQHQEAFARSLEAAVTMFLR